MSIVTYNNIDTPIFDIYYPRYLFASGEDGSLLPDLSSPGDSLFQDAAGTTPVTAYGDYVGLAVDQSGNGRDWVQSTNAARMRYDELTGQPILLADLADDAMDIELPAISGGTIVLAGDKGVWISELNFAGGTFSYGPTTYTGGPDQLIENLVGERLIGGFVIDRALTATERAQNIDYYMSRGAPGVWELGPELLVNGDFDDGFIGWDEGSNDYGQVVDGVARIGNSSLNARIWQSSVTAVGGIYLAGINIVDTGGPSASNNYTIITDSADSSGGNIYLVPIAAGVYSPFDSVVFSATSTTLGVRVAGGDTWTDIDSVSVRKLELVIEISALLIEDGSGYLLTEDGNLIYTEVA